MMKMNTKAGRVMKKPPANLKLRGEASRVAMMCAGRVLLRRVSTEEA